MTAARSVPAALMISTASLAVLAVPPTRVVPLSVPPPEMAREPPELTVVATASPPARTNILPPLRTVSPLSVPPEKTLCAEPWLTITLKVSSSHPLDAPTQTRVRHARLR
jgi:hypothetical protein